MNPMRTQATGQNPILGQVNSNPIEPIETLQVLPSGNSQSNPLGGSLLVSGGAIVFGLIAIAALIALLKSCLRICNPNEILIVSGRRYATTEGDSVGYRVLFGGRTLVIPILERVERMDMTTMPIPVEVTNAYAKGGTPLTIQAISNVKISGNPAIVGNAIERFLGRNQSEIRRVVKETLEGNLRGVVALLTPEQVNEDRLNFAERIAADVSEELAKLGVHLDTLKIQSVTDEVDYLKSIGRRQIAQIVRDAEIAEAETIGEADRIEADCQRQAEVSKTQALTLVQQKQNELRKIKAELEQRAKSEEERTIAAGREARARAEQNMQTIRAELERLRLEADAVLPAQAQKTGEELRARGRAAEFEENAKATALVNEMLSQAWTEIGPNASQIFLLQQLEMILKEAATIPHRLKIEEISVVDTGDGKTLTSLMNVYPEVVQQFLARIDQTLGLDVIGTLKGGQK
ncbi:MAG: SPFH domain-containing protein [Oculatellaceae cyanobacterium Prado106]|nr:SPFH domain-containing protein [Oculatellaceae cyanobacterium Prado106]